LRDLEVFLLRLGVVLGFLVFFFFFLGFLELFERGLGAGVYGWGLRAE